MKNNRQSMILDIIAKEHIETQEQLLEQLRQQYNCAEIDHIRQTDRQCADGKVTRLKQRQLDNRVFIRQFPDHQEDQRNGCNNGQCDNFI